MQHLGTTVIITLVIGFMLYRRFKRTVGFQRLARFRLQFRVALFAVIGCLIFYFGLLHPINWLAEGIGLVCGLVLSYYGIKHTRFEKREDGWYYSTHLGVQITVLLLLVARIGYKMLTLPTGSQAAAAANANPMDQFTKDPLTVGVFFVLVSFYICFFVYLLRKEKELDTQSA